MSAYEATLAVIDVLTGLGIPYVLARSYASNSYGVDRSTMDADFVVELGEGGPLRTPRPSTHRDSLRSPDGF
jgi:hypothetical protein